jgi:hypothetical protein
LTRANLWCVGEFIEARTGLQSIFGEVDIGSPPNNAAIETKSRLHASESGSGWTKAMALLTLTTSKTKTATTAVKTTAE